MQDWFRKNTQAMLLMQWITWVFIPLNAISDMFAYERQKGTLRRLLTTPTRKGTYLLGTIFGQVLNTLLQMVRLAGCWISSCMVRV